MGGRAGLEFFTVDPVTGRKTLVNDANDDAALPSYATFSPWDPPAFIRAVSPAPDTLNARPETGITVEIVDGATELNSTLISLKLDDLDVPAAYRREGSVTFVTYQPPNPMAHGSSHTARVSFETRSGVQRVQSWRFGVGGAPAEPAVTGHWNFRRGDLSAVVGQPLRFLDEEHGTTAARTRFGKTSDFAIPGIDGEDPVVMRFEGATHDRMGFIMTHGATSSNGDALVNQWTLILDLLIPNRSGESTLSIAQLDSVANQDEADFTIEWARRTSELELTGAPEVLFRTGGSARVLQRDTWHRLAYVGDFTTRRLTISVDGQRAAFYGWDPEVFALPPRVLLFADLFGQSQEVFVNSIQFRNYGMPPADISELGGPSASDIPGAE